MGSFGIMRVEKRKRAAVYGLQIEANRTKKDHEAGRDFEKSDIRWEDTEKNIHLVRCDNWNRAITAALKEAGIKERKDSVVMLDAVYTASPAFFEGKTEQEKIAYFKACLAFHEAHYGKAINAVIHLDETTPHMQVVSIPLVEKENKITLSAKTLMGGKADYSARQDAFYEEVSRKFGLERGERNKNGRKHLEKREWQLKELKTKQEQLEMVCKSLERKQYDHVLNEYFEKYVDGISYKFPDGRRLAGMEAFSEWFQRQMRTLFNQVTEVDGKQKGYSTQKMSNEQIRELQACYNYLKENYSPSITKEKEEIQVTKVPEEELER